MMLTITDVFCCDPNPINFLKFPHTISQVAVGAQSQLGLIASDTLQGSTGLLLPTPALSPPGETRSSTDRELLIQRIMEAVCPGRSVIQERSQGPDIELGLWSLLPVSAIPEMDAPTLVPGLEGGMDPSSPVPLEPVLGVDPPVRGWDRVCFSCGHHGHGVSQCSRMDTSFLFLLAGWSVGVGNGRYQATRTSVDGRNYTPGKGGWSGWEGQPLGSSEIMVRLTLEGESGFGEDARRLGNNRWGMSVDLPGPQMSKPFRPWGATLLQMMDGVNFRF